MENIYSLLNSYTLEGDFLSQFETDAFCTYQNVGSDVFERKYKASEVKSAFRNKLFQLGDRFCSYNDLPKIILFNRQLPERPIVFKEDLIMVENDGSSYVIIPPENLKSFSLTVDDNFVKKIKDLFYFEFRVIFSNLHLPSNMTLFNNSSINLEKDIENHIRINFSNVSISLSDHFGNAYYEIESKFYKSGDFSKYLHQIRLLYFEMIRTLTNIYKKDADPYGWQKNKK